MNSINDLEQQNSKELITKLADEAKIHLNQNKYLLEIIGIFKQQIKTVKNFITNYSLNSNQLSNNCNLALKYKEQLSVLNSKLREEINKNNKKQENILNNIRQDLSLANQTLTQFSVDNFILNNTIDKFNWRIKTLNGNIESSKKYDIFREPKRETEMEIKQSRNTIVLVNLENQQKMLSFCRSYENYKTKNIKKEKEIKIYKQKKSIFKNLIKFYGDKLYGDDNKILDDINKKNEQNSKEKVDITKRIKTNPVNKKMFPMITKNNLEDKDIATINEKEEDESNLNEKNESKNKINDNENDETLLNKTSLIIDNDTSLFKNIYNEKDKENAVNKGKRKKINILKIDELLDIDNISVENEEIIDDELNSDDEVFFEKKIKPKKKISTDFLNNIKKEVPSINLSQIEFNKLKVINEADAYSLQRRNFEQGNINGKIKNIRLQIKSLSKKVSMNKKKLDAIHNFIEDVKYNYKLLRPIKVQTSAAANPVHYIREKLLDAVEESINESEIKEKKLLSDNKFKTEKTALEEGMENDEEIVGSDYSDEDEYIEHYGNKDSGSDNKENIENKENENSNNSHTKKMNKNNKKRDIKTNLITKFESDEKENNKINHKKDIICHNNEIRDDILKNVSAQSK